MNRRTNPKEKARFRRKLRIRKKIRGTAERPRLSVFRSNRHIFAQIIDDENGVTLVATSSFSKEFRGKEVEGGKLGIARQVGSLLAQKAKAKGIDHVVFDRSGYLFHGRVKALAEAARKEGLVF